MAVDGHPDIRTLEAALDAVDGDARKLIDGLGVHFPNPFIRGVRFSLATGLHVIAAHDRRHMWQVCNVRKALERTSDAPRNSTF